MERITFAIDVRSYMYRMNQLADGHIKWRFKVEVSVALKSIENRSRSETTLDEWLGLRCISGNDTSRNLSAVQWTINPRPKD